MLDGHSKSDTANILHDLKISGLSSLSDSANGLNTPVRQNLKDFAAARGFDYQQDHFGNIYIERTGLDKELSAITLAFDLDSPNPGAASLLSGALDAFIDLEYSKTSCPIALLGWSSPGGHAIGRKCWDGILSKVAAYELVPELKQFEGLSNPDIFDIAALVEIVQEEAATVVRGSSLLTARIQTTTQRLVKIESSDKGFARVPSVCIRGKDAIVVGKEVVESYSRYVAGLFENFD
ncbi:hypothetical protein N431DRAFT_479712 [Stipitochalara longipes BDJ]|nr:hypothetical protein N431DRAFT_479712 [Stipitochalara longipes BDJ]